MRNVIVTGGSRGLGLGISSKLANESLRVIAIARKESSELTAVIQQSVHPESFQFVPFDLADIEGIADLVRMLRKNFGPLYGLVNNAGMSGGRCSGHDADFPDGAGGAIEHAVADSDDEIRALHDGRFGRPHRQHLFGGRLHRLQRAVSLQRYQGVADWLHPIVGKGGRAHRSERQCSRSWFCGYGNDQIVRRSALKRLVEVEDVANAVEFLLSDRAKNITGTVITVNAGNTA